MKFSALILAIIVFVLSCMPCRDDFAFNAGKSKIELDKSSQSQQGNHKTDSCSPFCSCSCCAGVNFNFVASSIDKIELQINKVKAFYRSSSIRKVALPIWQPPQLAA